MPEIKVSAEAMQKALSSFGADLKVLEVLSRSGTKVVTDRCGHTLTVMHRYGIDSEQAKEIFDLALKEETWTIEQIEAAMSEPLDRF